MRFILSAALIACAFALLMPAPTAWGQEEEPTPEELQEQRRRFQELFDRGLAELTEGEYPASIATFKKCIELVPGSTASYYNIACAYSKWGKTPEALEWLETSMEQGFLDFSHIARDPDMDPIRETEGFKVLVKKYQQQLLEAFEVDVDAPEGATRLLVFLHPNGIPAEDVRQIVRPEAERLGLILASPQGLGQAAPGMPVWTDLSDTTIPHLLDKVAADHATTRPPVLAGLAEGGSRALGVAIAHPKRFQRVLAIAPGELELSSLVPREEQLKAAAKAGLRVVLVSNAYDTESDTRMEALRAELQAAGIPVVLRRGALPGLMPTDVGTVLEEAIRFLDGRMASSGRL